MPTSSPAGAGDPLAPLLDLPGVAVAADAARDAVDRLLAHRVLRRSRPEVSAESALRGARASAALDGVDVPLDEVRDGVGRATDPVVQGALRASTELGRLAGTWERAPAQALARLHVLAAGGRERTDLLGRPSGDQQVAARLDLLSRLVTGGTRAPAIVLAAVVHGELLALDAFPVGGGVVARAAARLTMVARGLDRGAVSVPEVGHVELRAAYGPALAGYATGRPEAVAEWIRHCCAALELGAREGVAICEALRRA